MRHGWFGGDGGAAQAQRRMDLQIMIAEMRGYWESLRDGAALPSRAEINPRGIRGALSGAFLVEQIAPQSGRIRIAGQNFTDLLGMEARGMPLSAMFDPPARAAFGPLLAQVFDARAIVDLQLDCETGIGRPPIIGRMILLPLAECAHRGRAVMGCLALSGEVGKAPRRLSLRGHRSERIGGPPCDSNQPDVFAVKETAKARPYLRLVDLGR
ncbi:MAG: PAS domain-containing protein [Gemmobacter sp.]|nr:PAS domain-containing protein [Gemmobacter sp.]